MITPAPKPKPRRPRLTAKVARDLNEVVEQARAAAEMIDDKIGQCRVFAGCDWIDRLIAWHEASAEKRK